MLSDREWIFVLEAFASNNPSGVRARLGQGRAAAVRDAVAHASAAAQEGLKRAQERADEAEARESEARESADANHKTAQDAEAATRSLLAVVCTLWREAGRADAPHLALAGQLPPEVLAGLQEAWL